MAESLQAVKGMNDILPPDSARWDWLEDCIRRVMRRYAYRGIRTPIVEHTPLFVRGLGEVTDIVEKEMYSFTDSLNGDALSLRPEATAGIVRAVNEHNALYNGPLRVWLIGPMFRHERPQRGRYRQFHQLDVEALGLPGPDVDAEIILMCRAIWRELGLGEVQLQLNCLGEAAERREHRAALIAFFEAHAAELDADAQRRLHSNPLRILDTKNPAMQALVEAAPKLGDYLGEASRTHFAGLCALLDAAGQPYVLNPRLVRGMDYYNLTVFEWVTPHLGAQGTICGGGRYDGLIGMLGGKPAPGIGFGMGLERVLDLVDVLKLPQPQVVPDAYAIVPDSAAMGAALACVEALRAAGLAVQAHARGAEGLASMKAQFKRADASGARWALIFGKEELAQGEVALKPLRADPGREPAQRRLLLDQAAQWAAQLLQP
jgi:histidyl-tRNA synthetase